MSEDGLYIHKRHIRGDHGKMLEHAGTALQHTLIYVKTADKVCSPLKAELLSWMLFLTCNSERHGTLVTCASPAGGGDGLWASGQR